MAEQTADRRDLPRFARGDLWLDDDHAIDWEYSRSPGHETERVGAAIWHRVPRHELSATPGWCCCGIYWQDPHPEFMRTVPIALWTLVSLEPLHVEPSILCHCATGCQEHGFIREGRWVAA